MTRVVYTLNFRAPELVVEVTPPIPELVARQASVCLAGILGAVLLPHVPEFVMDVEGRANTSRTRLVFPLPRDEHGLAAVERELRRDTARDGRPVWDCFVVMR